MTLQEGRNELDRTRPAWEAVDLDGLYGLRKRNVQRTPLRPSVLAPTIVIWGSASDTADTGVCGTCRSCQAPAPGQIIWPRSNISRTSGRSACVDHLTQREFDRVDLLVL